MDNTNNIMPISTYYNKTNLRDYDLFTSNYYSGNDVSIFFGNTWVDEIVEIRYNIQEKAMPIYGYNSYTYDTVAKGNREIQGMFAINFTESGYLYAIIDKLTTEDDLNMPANVSDYGSFREERTLDSEKYLIDGEPFDAFAKRYEELMWGEYEKAKSDSRAGNAPMLTRKSFDIIIAYGPYTGDSSIASAEGYNSPRSTIKIIKDVTLTGVQHVVDTSDNSLIEVYSFIARDIIYI